MEEKNYQECLMLCTLECIIFQEESIVGDYLTGTKRHGVPKTFM